jgi:hypothetical protein
MIVHLFILAFVEEMTWVQWFCSLPGHEFFCEVSEEFIDDDFNLTGLAPLVPYYTEAMETIQDVGLGMCVSCIVFLSCNLSSYLLKSLFYSL